MTQTNGVEKITSKILAEAHAYEENELEKARADAKEIEERYRKAAQASYHSILDKAKAQAEERIQNAVNASAMNTRNELLSLKVSLLEDAFDKALEALCKLGQEESIELFSKVLVAAVNDHIHDGAPCEMVPSEKDAGIAPAIIQNAIQTKSFQKGVEIKLSDQRADIRGGFYLKSGPVEVNCSAEALIGAAKISLEKKVYDLLFNDR